MVKFAVYLIIRFGCIVVCILHQKYPLTVFTAYHLQTLEAFFKNFLNYVRTLIFNDHIQISQKLSKESDVL